MLTGHLKEPLAEVAVFQNLLVSVFRLLGLHSTGMCLTNFFTLLMSPWGFMPPYITLANLIPPQSLTSEIARQQVQTHKLKGLIKSSSCPIYPALATMLKRNLGNKLKKTYLNRSTAKLNFPICWDFFFFRQPNDLRVLHIGLIVIVLITVVLLVLLSARLSPV